MYFNKTEIFRDGWKILHDPDNEGRDEKWFEKGILDKSPRDAFIPGLTHQFYFYEYGIFWYEKKFVTKLTAGDDEVFMLRIGSANFYLETYLNGKLIGTHRGTEDPFEYDVTDIINRDGENDLIFRISKPYFDERVDGFTHAEVPHRNERKEGVILPGMCQNECGFYGNIELAVLPKCRITDMYITADTETSLINVQYTIHSDFAGKRKATILTDCGNKRTGEHINCTADEFYIKKGDTVIKTSVKIDGYTRWDINDPFLYYVNAELSTTANGKPVIHTLSKHTGFRTFVVKPDGFFYLNDRRIFLRCSHTGNCMPLSTHNVPPSPEFIRKDLYMAKAAGLNTVRFISGAALPDQLDYADELGLMIYEEPVSSWLQCDGPHSKELYQFDLLTMVKRDRSHPSICIWGMLNETVPTPPFGEVCRWGRESLPDLRDLDETRLVLYSSGRFDGDAWTGSVANPGDREWQCVWNREDKNSKVHVGWEAGSPGGFFKNVGDIHVYPRYPTSKEDMKLIREIGNDVKRPVFISEYGCGSLFDVIWLSKVYKSWGVSKDLPDVRQVKMMEDYFLADLKRYGFEEEFAFPGDILRKSQEMHCRQRALAFDLVRSNPYMNGFSITGLLDHSICGEGLWTFMREWKPGIVDAIQNGFAPLKWCIFPSDTNVYTGKTFHINVVLANEDILKEQDYPVTLKIFGECGTVYTKKSVLHPTAEQLKLFSVPVFDEDVCLDVPEGTYEIKCDIEDAPAMDGTLKFFVMRDDITSADKGITVAEWGLNKDAVSLLERKGIKVVPLSEVDEKSKALIVIGNIADTDEITSNSGDRWSGVYGTTLPVNREEKKAIWDKIYRMIENGSRAFAASRHAIAGPEGWSTYLRVENKPNNWPNYDGRTDWLYHKEYINKRNHPYFKNLPTGIMDWEYWVYLICGADFRDGKVPDDVASASFGPGNINEHGYDGGFNIGTYNIGKGALTVNAYELLGNIGVNPAADRLLINIINEESKKL